MAEATVTTGITNAQDQRLKAVVDDNTFAVGESVHFLFFAEGGVTALQYDVPHRYVSSWRCFVGRVLLLMSIIICLFTEELVIYLNRRMIGEPPKDPGASEMANIC